jgi:hypothetical protein
MNTKPTPAGTLLKSTALLAIIDRIEGLVDWHADLYADIENLSPDDMHAHCNGLVLQACKEARDILANAQLIAAAPDLLEALQNLENDDGSIPEHAWKLCQAAISKAISSANVLVETAPPEPK